jgi:pilus assembly protein CpaE
MIFIGSVPFCGVHSQALAPEPKSLVEEAEVMVDGCHDLAEMLGDSVNADILTFLGDLHGSEHGVSISSDAEMKEVSHGKHKVWWRTWGAYTAAGYMTRVAMWMPQVARPQDRVVTVLLDGKPVYEQVPELITGPDWGFISPDDLLRFNNHVMSAIGRGTFSPGEPTLPESGEGIGGRLGAVDDDAPTRLVERPRQLKLVIMAEDDFTVADVAKLVRGTPGIEISGAPLDPGVVINMASVQNPDCILLSVTSDRVDGATLVKKLHAHMPSVPIIMVADNQADEDIVRAKAVGAHDVMVWPFEPGELVVNIMRAVGLEAELPAGARTLEVISSNPVQPGHELPARTGQITAVLAGKGGVGTTLMSMNVAAALADSTGHEAGIVDLDLQFGDLALLMGIKPSTSMGNVVENFGQLDREYIHKLMPQAGGHLRLMPATPSPELADLVTGEHVRGLVSALRTLYEHTVFDCGCHLDDRTLEVIQNADTLILVTDLSLACVKNSRLMLSVLEKLGIPPRRIFVLVNRADVPGVVAYREVENLLRQQVVGEITTVADRMLQKSIEAGTPVYRLFPQSDLTNKLKVVVDRIGYGRMANRPTLFSN